MANQMHIDKTITKIQDMINNKRERSNHPATVKVAHFLREARKNPAKRQEFVEKALKCLPNVPESDNVPDLAQKIKNEATKDLNSSEKSIRTRAINAVKRCDRLIAPVNDDFMVLHAGSGPEGILRGSGPGGILFEKDIKKELPRSNVKNEGDGEPTMMELMLAYAGS